MPEIPLPHSEQMAEALQQIGFLASDVRAEILRGERMDRKQVDKALRQIQLRALKALVPSVRVEP